MTRCGPASERQAKLPREALAPDPGRAPDQASSCRKWQPHSDLRAVPGLPEPQRRAPGVSPCASLMSSAPQKGLSAEAASCACRSFLLTIILCFQKPQPHHNEQGI